MNERIRLLRKDFLHMTLDKFGERIGLKKSALSHIENGKVAITDQNVKSICREFGVREEWLRDGTGDDPFGPQTRNQKILAFANQVMSEEEESFKKSLVDSLAELDESDWEILEKIALKVLKRD